MDTCFDPIPCTRFDGWTPARQLAFVRALAAHRSVTGAATAVGMTTQGAYRLRRHPAGAGFRAAWDAALADPPRPAEPDIEVVIGDSTQSVDRGGKRLSRRRPCPPQVLIALMAKCERLANGARAE